MNLKHKRILITRPRAQAEEFAKALTAEGAHPIFFPVIEIAFLNDYTALDSALLKLNKYDWLILTSIHGVDIFFKRLELLGIQQLPQQLQLAVIGAKTALRLSEHGVKTNFVPSEYRAESILSGLDGDISGKYFLLPQSNLARELLAKEIRSAGGIVDEVIAYHTRTIHPDSLAINNLRAGIDIITFASPSSVKGFINVLAQQGLDIQHLSGNPLVACIGPVTALAAREAGLLVAVEARKHTMNGLVDALKKV